MRVNYELLKRAIIVHGHASGWNAQSHTVLDFLGCKKPPIEGMPARKIQGVTVWVESLADARAKGLFHRVRCGCPYCGSTMSLGRLHQHVMVHGEEIVNG